jgi:hypothetical protein
MTGNPLSDAALLIAAIVVFLCWLRICEAVVNRACAAWGKRCGQRTRGGR